MYSCTSPLYRVPKGTLNFGRLTGFDQKRERNGGVFLSFYELKQYEEDPHWSKDSVQVLRCGQCSSCRLHSSFEWAVRCQLESDEHEHNYFVTLTYDDFHLPRQDCIDYNGVIWDSILVRRDVQLFMKNLREWERTTNNNTGVKVFYCGEYGDLNGRPHYHICLFGVSEIPDLSFSYMKGDYKYYKSVLYESFWSERHSKIPRGFVDISELSFDTVAYTARYVMKKQKGKICKDFMEYYGTLEDPLPIRPQPFIGMSNRPGIGSAYFEKNKNQLLLEDKVKFTKKFKLFMCNLPRYFSKLFERDMPDDFEKLKRRRARAGILSRKLKKAQVSESEQSRLRREADIVNAKENRFRRRNL